MAEDRLAIGVENPTFRTKLLFWVTLGVFSTFFAEVISGSTPFPFLPIMGAWGMVMVTPLYAIHILVFAYLVYRYGGAHRCARPLCSVNLVVPQKPENLSQHTPARDPATRWRSFFLVSAVFGCTSVILSTFIGALQPFAAITVLLSYVVMGIGMFAIALRRTLKRS